MRLTKSVFAVILTVAMVIGISLLPVSAEVSVDYEYLNVYVENGTAQQSQGGVLLEPLEALSTENDPPKIENDATLNRDVIVFDGTNSYKLGAAMAALPEPQDYTFEILVWISSEMRDAEVIYILGNTSMESGTGFYVKQNKLSLYAHDGVDYKLVSMDCPYDQWLHLVGVYDSTDRAITMYANGELIGTTDMEGHVKFWQRWQGTSDKLVLGSDHDIGGGGGFYGVGALKGKVAYAKVYDTVVSAEDAATLYEESGIGSGGGNTTTSPSASASASPSASDGNGGATAAPTNRPQEPNAGTFDMGIVSFAAVALSSLVAVKKRK